MPMPRKPSDRRQNRVTRDVLGPVSQGVTVAAQGAALAIPEPPIPIKAKAKRYWEAFWRSEVAQAISPDADAFVLVRWIAYVDEWNEVTTTLRKEGLTVQGSTGQTVLHPLAKHRATLDSAISAIERELGLTPKARATLGLAVNALHKSAADLMTDIQTMEPVLLPEE